MPTQVCIFNPVTKLIDLVTAASTVSGLSADAGKPVVLDAAGFLDGSFTASRTAVTTASYITVTTDRHVGVTYTATGAVTVTLYDASTAAPGAELIIKDEAGNAAVHNITIATMFGQTIDGVSPTPITTNHGVLRVYSDGTNWQTF